MLEEDDARWRRWSAGVDLTGPFAAAVQRSVITLRLLTYSPSGAPVAAATTSLPEQLGGGRNWDYRFVAATPASGSAPSSESACTPRPAPSSTGSCTRAAWTGRASRAAHRVRPIGATEQEPLGVARLRGQPAGPVRQRRPYQHQLDNYGWVLDAMWLLERAGHRLYGETWRIAMALADHVADRWREPDAGLWEVRSEPAHHVHSKLMAWLALDRALRIADRHPAPDGEHDGRPSGTRSPPTSSPTAWIGIVARSRGRTAGPTSMPPC